MEKRGLLSSRGMGDSGASIRAAFAAAAGLSFAALLLVACVYTPERLERGFGEGHATALFGEGGLGTFPGGQSTGGYSEFDFEVNSLLSPVEPSCQPKPASKYPLVPPPHNSTPTQTPIFPLCAHVRPRPYPTIFPARSLAPLLSFLVHRHVLLPDVGPPSPRSAPPREIRLGRHDSLGAQAPQAKSTIALSPSSFFFPFPSSPLSPSFPPPRLLPLTPQPPRSDHVTTQVWTVVAGPCKGMGSVDELKACVRGKLDVSASGDAGRAAVQEAKRIHFALTRPGSAGVGKQSSNPSLEDIIGANQMPDMSGTNKRLDDLQRQMDGIVNHRLLDTEDLTKETSDMWRARTSNLCCQDMFDTVCNQPCHF